MFLPWMNNVRDHSFVWRQCAHRSSTGPLIYHPHLFMKARNLRDMAKRVAAAEAEPLRQALRYISRNMTLAPRARAQAQLQLGNMSGQTRINQVKNRCVETGRGRGVLRDFRLCRVSFESRTFIIRLHGAHRFYSINSG